MEFSSKSLIPSDINEFEQIAANIGSKSGFKFLLTGEIPFAIPFSLRAILTRKMLMWEQSPSKTVYLIFDGVRLDAKDNTLDNQWFGVAVCPSGADARGVFITHGQWQGPFFPLSTTHIGLLTSTSLGQYFPLSKVPNSSSGPINDLAKTSHEGAFNRMMNHFLSVTRINHQGSANNSLE